METVAAARADDHQHVEGFLAMLAAERGAAVNTLQAYRRDLDEFLAFLGQRGKSLPTVQPSDIGAYLRSRSEAGLASSSRARSLSAIRQLFKFLSAEGVIARRSRPSGSPAQSCSAPSPRRCR